MIAFMVSQTIKRSTRIIALSMGLGLALTIPAYAELPAALTQDIAKVNAASAPQRQALANVSDGALRAGVSEQDLSKVINQGIARNYSASDITQYVEKLSDLRSNGLPGGLVRDKILEGMAKSTPPSTILQVATNWSVALGDANTALRNLEQKGLNYANPSEREALINIGATLQQRHGVKQPLLVLAGSSLDSGRSRPGVASLHAAANLAELLLLRGAKAEQALSLPTASLRANYSAQRIQELQRAVADQLRQGVAVTDIVAMPVTVLMGNGFLGASSFTNTNPGGPGSPGTPSGPGGPGGFGGQGAPGNPAGPGNPGAFGSPGAPGGQGGMSNAGRPGSPGGPGAPGGAGFPGGPGGFQR